MQLAQRRSRGVLRTPVGNNRIWGDFWAGQKRQWHKQVRLCHRGQVHLIYIIDYAIEQFEMSEQKAKAEPP